MFRQTGNADPGPSATGQLLVTEGGGSGGGGTIPVGGVAVKKYYTSAGAVTDGIVWSPAAGKRWYATTIFVGVSAASTVTLEDDLTAGDSPVFKMEFAGNSGVVMPFAIPLFSGEDAADLLITSTAGNVYVTVTGYEA